MISDEFERWKTEFERWTLEEIQRLQADETATPKIWHYTMWLGLHSKVLSLITPYAQELAAELGTNASAAARLIIDDIAKMGFIFVCDRTDEGN
jgi:hypothetical protein